MSQRLSEVLTLEFKQTSCANEQAECTLIYSSADLLCNLRDDGVSSDAALIVLVTRHVNVAIHAPVLAPAVLHNPELGCRLAAGHASGVGTDLRIIGATRVRLTRLFE